MRSPSKQGASIGMEIQRPTMAIQRKTQPFPLSAEV